METELDQLKNILSNKKINRLPKDNFKILANIYNLFINNIIFDPHEDIEMYFLGVYYETKNNYDEMVKYHLMASDKEYIYSIFELGKYYAKKKDYGQMKKYYLISINKGFHNQANNLGYYYKKRNKYDKMIKYYLMAIENNNICAMFNLGSYYRKIRDYENMKKYFIMGVNAGDSDSMYVLGHHYAYIEGDLIMATKYYIMAAEHNDDDAYYKLGNLNKHNKKLYEMYYMMGFNDRCAHSDENNYVYMDDLKTLEILINFSEFYKRESIVRLFNKIIMREIFLTNEQKFINLLKSFEFRDNDTLCPILRIIIELMK